ncbi:MFS transporter [Chelatococcus asaccharovorans]|uniref:Sugar transport protein n=1 Tax=Chelatococcus asaccharovorans TaxID=28210 RepID=A0A2V3U5M3_9HYPH|nr:MFS transporter [Chelatococcus asaccharovorans]MBS7704083.1 MHS family MFS transporter [Chelatococcus asaccharovorans]PXW58249.1 sugar transport protein [Chelatococcus asaccharovorans]
MSVATADSLKERKRPMTREERKVIVASSLGTVFEWYDFYLAGSLAANISMNFFSGVNPTAGFIFTLLGFAAGFAVRPFGALFFGRLGDLIGRKYTFLVTMTVMGISTFVVGLLPSYAAIGILAPIAFVACRLLQGLALGGEYGGAATYVAEHAPQNRRGFYTSWIQTTATVGLFLSLIVILVLRLSMSTEAFNDWGWRVPFLVSILLLGVSIWIRLQLQESPAFVKMKEEGTGSKAPLTEAFGKWKNAKIALIALFGGTAGQAVVWYTGQFYALFFLTQTLKIDGTTANILIALALLIGTPFFIVFGWLSDKIGRKPIILAGCLIAAISYFPLFAALGKYGNPDLIAAQEKAPVTVIADPAECSFQFNPVGTSSFTTSCDIAKSFLARNAVNYANEAAPAGTVAKIRIGNQVIESFDARSAGAEAAAKTAAFTKTATDAIRSHGYPAAADPAKISIGMMTLILTVLVIFVTMVYGPIAALLVELFPTRIRYSGMSLPYHIGNGWFGGFLPPTAFAIVAATGNIYSGLWYPIIVALMTFVVGLLLMPETKDRDIFTYEGEK